MEISIVVIFLILFTVFMNTAKNISKDAKYVSFVISVLGVIWVIFMVL